MTQPGMAEQPWQIYSADYDTQASYYGVKKASEPLHVQMNLPDYALRGRQHHAGAAEGPDGRAAASSHWTAKHSRPGKTPS